MLSTRADDGRGVIEGISERGGWYVNGKRVHRLWPQAGLAHNRGRE
jgi:hypothetical protein